MRSDSVISLRTFLLAAIGTAAACGGSTSESPDTTTTDAGAHDSSTSPVDGGGITDATTNPDVTKTDGGQTVDGGPPTTCAGATPILIDGKDTGFDTCGDGRIVRRAAVTCPELLPRNGGGTCPYPDAGISGTCSSDTDCTGPHSYCGGGGDVPACSCVTGCVSDLDCPSGHICRCGDPVGQCIEATCKDSSLCGGGDCVLYDSSNGCGIYHLACTTGADACKNDSDCAADGAVGGKCIFDATGQKWSCSYGSCAIGRPFTVDEETRVAPTTRRSDWKREHSVAAVDAVTRARVAAHWSNVAQLEHASIASFARFVLELLALGAGPDLVDAAQAAIADELRHAQIAFGLCSAYGGAPVGPGPLAIQGSVPTFSLDSFVEHLVREGCVGETLGALEAAEAAARAGDPELAHTLEGVAQDEARHAALAWKTLRIALARGGDATKRLAERAIERALADLDASLASADPTEGLEAHGVLSTATRRALHRRGAHEVIAACRDAIA